MLPNYLSTSSNPFALPFPGQLFYNFLCLPQTFPSPPPQLVKWLPIPLGWGEKWEKDILGHLPRRFLPPCTPTTRAAFSSAALQEPPTMLMTKARPLTCMLDPIPSCLLQHRTSNYPLFSLDHSYQKTNTLQYLPLKEAKTLDPAFPTSHHPISLLPLLAQVLKKFVSSHCHHFLSSELSFHPLQIFTPTIPPSAFIEVAHDTHIPNSNGQQGQKHTPCEL